MSYAGNTSLPSDVQKRILETFRHTLDVAARGGLEEAKLGCDFVLQLDPQFSPAQALSDRLHGASGALAVDDLRARIDGAAAAPPAPRPAAAQPPRPQAPAAPQPPAAATRSPAGDLRRELAQLLAARDFPALMSRAQRDQAAIAADPDLQALLGNAQELMEAAPYVDRFLDKARKAHNSGNRDEAQSFLEKARALDPGHPALGGTVKPAAAPPPSAGAPSRPGVAPIRPAAAEASHELDADLPPDELSFADLPTGDVLPMDLPPLELPDLDASSMEELSLEGLAGDAAPARAGGGASDPDPRIAELLDEGDTQFGRGELQGAIDAWSRIFLIDIDHEEAARRIDRARNAKAEQERKVEEAYHDALARVQAKDWDGARETLQRVLEMHPNHVAAREALGKLERGELTDLPRVPTPSGESALLDELAAADDADLKEEILVPPEPGQERARPVPVPVKQPPSRRTLAMVAAVVVVVLLAGGWFLKSRWSSLFPNTEAPPTATPALEQTPITRATDLYKQGKRAVAIAQLKRVPPASPYYEEAQALIGQWQQEETAATAPTGPSPELLAKRGEIVAAAQQAESERRFLKVGPLLDQAAAISPLAEDELAMRERANAAIEPLKSMLTLLRAEEYDRSLRDLWIILEKDPANADARQMLTIAYYNMGVLNLQQGKPDEAETNFKEAADLSPDDQQVQRLLRFAQTYKERAPDLIWRIFTKYVGPRPV